MGTKISALTTTGSAPADSYIPIAYDGENYKVIPSNVNSVSTAQGLKVYANATSDVNMFAYSNHPDLYVEIHYLSNKQRCDVYNAGSQTLVHAPEIYLYKPSGTMPAVSQSETNQMVVLQPGHGVAIGMGYSTPGGTWTAGGATLYFSNSYMGKTADEWITDTSMPTNYSSTFSAGGSQHPTIQVP